MIRTLCLRALCVALAILPPVAAGAQQALVPARPVYPTAPATPDWFETNRTAQVLRAQELPHPAVRGQSGLGGAEATQIYQNYLQGIGRQPGNNSGRSGFAPPTEFGSNGTSSGYGPPQ